ncbi:MAG: FAD-dependent oxidoreductase [Candidatus Competibacterales bacterium]
MNHNGKWALVALVIVLIGVFFAFDLDQYFSLTYNKDQQTALVSYYQANPYSTAAAFFAIYVLVTALSLPGAAIMTVVAGAIFGVTTGSVLVSFASSIGATLAFLIARYLFRDAVQSRFGQWLTSINRGIEREGAFYLFAMRLVPAIPFFVINLVMGLTPIRTVVFYLVSQVGMLPATIVYVNAGTQLAQLESLGDIASFDLIASFVLLGLFPFIAKRLLGAAKAIKAWREGQRQLAPFAKPKRFDRNLVVIGAGAAGLVSSYIAAAVKAKVSLIEKHKMGGDCLNYGCVPSKALIRSARILNLAKRAEDFGLDKVEIQFDFAKVMERVHRVVKAIEPHDSVERYQSLGVDVIQGEATIKSPYEVEVNGRTLTTRNIIIATGASPLVPPIEGLAEVGYLTSDTVWNLRTLPRRLVVLGGGPIGCELAQTFARFGSQVTQVEMGPRILAKEDPEVSEVLAERFAAEGIKVLTEHKAVAFERSDSGEKHLIADHNGEKVSIPFDEVLLALGRKPRTEGFGLEALGIPVDKTVETNAYLQTLYPNIYAVGDVAGPYQFTHVGAHQAWFGAVNALFGHLKKFKADYSVIPWATFTDPEIAHVGLNESMAKAQGIDYEVTTYGIDDLDRAIAEGEAHGFVRVLTVPGKDKILGATIVGENAGEIIVEYVAAMRHGFGMNKILSTVHIYPTLAEANKYAAGRWKQAHTNPKVLEWLARYHGFWRGEGFSKAPSTTSLPAGSEGH